MAKISVIMPVYNSEIYLESAIQSVINQTFVDWELILVDDGSKDASGEICDSFSRKDTRIKVFHQNNSGISRSRNRGLTEAKGDFIAFLDNDDYYDINMLQRSYNVLKEYNADCVRCGVNLVKYDQQGQLKKTESREISHELILSGKEIFDNYFMLKDTLLLNTVWNGVYSSDFLRDNHIQFREDIKWGYDDQIFNFDILRYIKKMVVIPEKLYTWQIRENYSTSEKADISRLEEIYETYQCEESLIHDKLRDYRNSHQWYIRVGYYIRYSIVALARIDNIDCIRYKNKIDVIYKYPILHPNIFAREFLNLAIRTPKHAFLVLLLIMRWKRMALELTKLYMKYKKEL